MKTYEKYKDSGVEWIGQVPEHWEVLPTKRLGQFVKGLSFTKKDLTDNGQSVISYGQIHSKTNDGVHLRKELIRYVPQAFIYESARVSKGDFVFADTSEDYEGCGNCVLNNTGEQLYAGYHTIVLRTSSEENQYLGYLFNTDIWRWQIRSRVGGVKVFSITQSILAQTSIILPPLPEQRLIASYLDARCGRIDRVVEAERRRIALLDELRQSIITQAVTQGLNPDAPLKDSGVEWIGQVPEHWEVVAFKRAASINNGCDYKHIQVESDGYPVLGSGGKFAEASQYMYDGEVLLLGRKGTIDRPLYYVGKFWAVDTMFYTIPQNGNSCRYLYYQALTFPFERYSTATALPSMTQTDLGNNGICLPPLPEQRAIVSYLDTRLASLDAQKAKSERRIALLNELRQSIITEAVTGKVRIV